MKERNISHREKIKAESAKRGQVIEIGGQRIRLDRIDRVKGGRLRFTQMRFGGRRLPRRVLLGPKKNVQLCHPR